MADIDREKVRAAVRRLGPEDVFFLLDEALELLSPAQLAALTKDVIHAASLVADGASPKTLLEQVNAFKKASLATSGKPGGSPEGAAPKVPKTNDDGNSEAA